MERIYSSDELEVCEEVGRGGFGVVYRGVLKSIGKEVAIKQIDLESESADLFEVNREITILSECRIPQITRYLGSFVKNYKLWVIMEYVSGGSLFDLLKAGPITDERLVAAMAKEVLIALAYLHDQGKIHRDLKSHNILLGHDGEVKLTDFGVSTQLSSNFSRRNTTVGTPYWMAPEVILNNTGGHSYKADIWSLGCCVFELRNGKPPLQEHFAPMKALRQISSCRNDGDFWELIQTESSKSWSHEMLDFFHRCFVLQPSERWSARRLLRHKFIQKADEISEEQRRRDLRKLITKKHLWDQEHHITRTRRYYAPTEIQMNQQRWLNGGVGDAENKENRVEFDLSSVKDSTKLAPDERASASHKTTPSPAPSNKQEINTKNLASEFIRILNRVFHKIESRNSLPREQYDQLIELNDSLIRLFVPARVNEDSDASQSRILIAQYLRYLVKELVKPQPENSTRLQLQKQILPSAVHETIPAEPVTLRGKKTSSTLDEIEKSLLESWLDKMKND
ncbi:uncharacterized protein CXQ87_002442 [Candidozyma duobushaemuli]|uniref:non-specific serine/threonine protein kinase n=2 Tax=Candidozyma TaxID=3303203 RepID=A0ABX8I2N0_9ASCO|nr:uncharacterized protein CXQ87_002442 [[Candida] duobushaemulonis]PVH14314.1 hypothetical protein CXQ87_002442 [[Candida] duobushaemulonis]QWU87511.1 hypothetical protein CA3LBN_001776 [[Candida] haemuloni]